jgi:hypothetical protein
MALNFLSGDAVSTIDILRAAIQTVRQGSIRVRTVLRLINKVLDEMPAAKESEHDPDARWANHLPGSPARLDALLVSDELGDTWTPFADALHGLFETGSEAAAADCPVLNL